MDPGLIFIAAIIGFRILRVVQSQQKKKAATNPMQDLSNRSMRPAAKLARKSAERKAKHKRNREDPFDGMDGDVLKSNLTIDDIVS